MFGKNTFIDLVSSLLLFVDININIWNTHSHSLCNRNSFTLLWLQKVWRSFQIIELVLNLYRFRQLCVPHSLFLIIRMVKTFLFVRIVETKLNECVAMCRVSLTKIKCFGLVCKKYNKMKWSSYLNGLVTYSVDMFTYSLLARISPLWAWTKLIFMGNVVYRLLSSLDHINFSLYEPI